MAFNILALDRIGPYYIKGLLRDAPFLSRIDGIFLKSYGFALEDVNAAAEYKGGLLLASMEMNKQTFRDALSLCALAH